MRGLGLLRRTARRLRPRLTPEGLLKSDLWLDQPDALAEIDRRRTAGELDDAEAEGLAHFVEYGYLTLELDHDGELYHQLDADADRLWNERPAEVAYAYQGLLTPMADGDPADRRPSCRVADLHAWSETALELYLDPKIFRTIELIFGESAVATQSLYFEWGSQQRLHRDPAYVQTTPPSHLAAAWIALEDIHPDSGPLVYVPGSHRLPYYQFAPGEFVFNHAFHGEAELDAGLDWDRRNWERAGLEPRSFTPRRGEVLIWHHSLLHGGSTPTDPERTRKSFVVHYGTRRTMKRVRNAYRRAGAGEPRVLVSRELVERGERRGFKSPLSSETEPLRIALLGSRGIPARYGGYETLMEEIAVRLAEMGHRVTVYCRSHYTRREEREHHGVRLVVLPTLRTKYLDTPVHTFLSCWHALFGRYDAALVVNSANAIFLPILRLGRLPVALHVDGIEKRRAKWGPLGRAVYALSERLACRFPNVLVTDAGVIRDHYLERYGADSRMITYGVDPRPPESHDVLEHLGLEERRYFLYVSRFEPENNPHRVVEAFAGVGGDLPLVMLGDAPYADRFIAGFRRGADRRILFPGSIYGDGYRQLLSGALAYVHATEVGGTHPALVEAMGYGNCLVVNDTPENREVAGEAALYFRAAEPETLTAALETVRRDPQSALERGRAAARRAEARFSWESVSREYAELFEDLSQGHGGKYHAVKA